MSSIEQLFDRPIAFQRAFVDLGIGIAGALMLSQCVYWAKRAGDEGWFYKSQQDWEDETGMNRREQERARKALKGIGVLEEKRRGVPARMYFRLNQEALEQALIGTPRELSLDAVLQIYKTTLHGLSKTGLMRAKKLGAAAEYVDYAEVLKRDGLVCGCCGKPINHGPGQHKQALSFDHKTPLSEGGEHIADNLQPSHMECNISKAGNAESSLSAQDNLSSSTQEQASLSTQDKQECLGETNKPVYPSQSITEITTETTSEITAERSSGPDRPDTIPAHSDENHSKGKQEPSRPNADIENGKHWGTRDDHNAAVAMWVELETQMGEDKPRQPSIARWANTVRLMRERDGRQIQHIRALWRWCRQHSFWAANIQSPDKLREKWGQLAMQRKTERRQTPPAADSVGRAAELRRIHEQRTHGTQGVTYEH